MPFKSKAQQRFMFAKHPEVAKEMADKTPKSAYKKMPEHVEENKGHSTPMAKGTHSPEQQEYGPPSKSEHNEPPMNMQGHVKAMVHAVHQEHLKRNNCK